MFKAFLRTDGAVVVTGGDVAWHFQRKQFQRQVTKAFALMLRRMSHTTVLSDFSASERTVVCEVEDFMEIDAPKVSDSEYLTYRAIIREIVERNHETNQAFAQAL